MEIRYESCVVFPSLRSATVSDAVKKHAFPHLVMEMFPNQLQICITKIDNLLSISETSRVRENIVNFINQYNAYFKRQMEVVLNYKFLTTAMDYF